MQFPRYELTVPPCGARRPALHPEPPSPPPTRPAPRRERLARLRALVPRRRPLLDVHEYLELEFKVRAVDERR